MYSNIKSICARATTHDHSLGCASLNSAKALLCGGETPNKASCVRDTDIINSINIKQQDILDFARDGFLIGVDPSFTEPQIVISRSRPQKKHGKNNKEKLIKAAKDIEDRLAQMPSCKGPEKEAIESLKSILRYLINDEAAKCDGYDWLDRELERLQDESGAFSPKIRELLGKVIRLNEGFKNVITLARHLGCYSAPQNTITLYICTICEICEENGLDFESKLTAVYAHELFHAIHYSQIRYFYDMAQKGSTVHDYWQRGSYCAGEAVLESLARAFEYHWCKYMQNPHNDAIAEELNQEIKTARFPGWPYAGAKIFIDGDEYAFKYLYNTTFERDWEYAYEVLMDIGKSKQICI